MHLLDTDILSLLQRGDTTVRQRVLASTSDQVAVTIISIEEQTSGWIALLRKSNRPDKLAVVYQRWTHALSALVRLPIRTFSLEAIHQFQALRRLRLGVGSMDLRIAAIALAEDAILVTRNSRDFGRVPGLKFEDWSH